MTKINAYVIYFLPLNNDDVTRPGTAYLFVGALAIVSRQTNP
jgi:hypothetical protein